MSLLNPVIRRFNHAEQYGIFVAVYNVSVSVNLAMLERYICARIVNDDDKNTTVHVDDGDFHSMH